MAKQYERITKYLEILDTRTSGEWIEDTTSKGTKDDPIHLPWVSYSSEVDSFVQVFFDEFADIDYWNNLEKRGLALDDLATLDISDFDGDGICTLITAVIRGDRFCEGILKEYIDNGVITRWLKRLLVIDEYR